MFVKQGAKDSACVGSTESEVPAGTFLPGTNGKLERAEFGPGFPGMKLSLFCLLSPATKSEHILVKYKEGCTRHGDGTWERNHLMHFSQISRLNHEVSQLSRELRHMMDLLQARLGPPTQPAASAWPPHLTCSQLRPPGIPPFGPRPVPGPQDTTLAEVHCPAGVGPAAVAAAPTDPRPSTLSPYPSEPDPLAPSPVPEASPSTPSLMRHSFRSRSDTFH